ncbi:MAG: xanthine dehydrogenase small subunit [Pseudomonadota bacterium]
MRTRLRFLIGQERRELAEVEPTLTVLDYLRQVERRMGTKEGCAEGDCGACTVVLARPVEGRIRYCAVNSCILFLGQIDGCQLLTVEDLPDRRGTLHPVQEAMVECHATQCGFCTPGFVMSLFALYENTPRPDDGTPPPSTQRIDDALAGNLCRCTGYQPIVAAAERMFELGRGQPDRFASRRPDMLDRLEALEDNETLAVGHGDRRFFAPASVEALAALLLDHPTACVVAGATDVGLWVTKDLRELDPLIHIGRVRELQQIVDIGSGLEIGAGVTYADAEIALSAHYPDMGELLRRLGGEQVRNLGTIGGNIANGSPIGDSPPALIAMSAQLVLRRGDEQREMALEDFFIEYGKQDRRPSEFVEKIIVPKPARGTRFRAYKVAKRFDQDISSVLGAFALRLQHDNVASIRIAYGGMAGTPQRALHAENALRDQPWNAASVEAAIEAMADDFSPISDWRASAAYRNKAARNLLHRLLIETTEHETQTRLVGNRDLARV